MTIELNGGYSVWQIQCTLFHFISQSQDFQHWSCSPYKFQKTWSTSFHYHINLGWLCNLRFDYSKNNLWRLCLVTYHFNYSTNAISGRFAIVCCKKHPFSTNTKISWYTKINTKFCTALHNCQWNKLVFIICGWLALR